MKTRQPVIPRTAVRGYQCPACGAIAGEKCKNSRGQPRESNHEERVQKFLADQDDENDYVPQAFPPHPAVGSGSGKSPLEVLGDCFRQVYHSNKVWESEEAARAEYLRLVQEAEAKAARQPSTFVPWGGAVK
jgi:hypothetical protein